MRPLVAVVALVLVAGCSGFAPVGPSAGTPTGTATPAPVPTERSIPADGPAALAGSLDAREVSFAHGAALTGRSYTVRERTVVRYGNGTVRSRVAVVRRVADDGTYAATVDAAGERHPLGAGQVRGRFWSDGPRLLYALASDGTTYGVVDPANYNFWRNRYVALAYPRPGRTVYTPLRVTNPRVVGHTTDTLRFRVVGDDTTAPQLIDTPPGVTGPRNASLRAQVDRNGVVRHYRFTYEATADGAPVTVTTVVRYEDIGRTTVERPDWYEKAVNESA